MKRVVKYYRCSKDERAKPINVHIVNEIIISKHITTKKEFKEEHCMWCVRKCSGPDQCRLSVELECI
jgi:hypothetical protein